MKHTSQWAIRLTTATLPLAFCSSGFLNIIAFALGLHTHNTVRRIFVVGILGAATLLFFCQAVLLYVRNLTLRRPIRLMALIPLVFSAIHLWALFIQPDKGYILKSGIIEGCYLVSAWSALILIVSEKCLRSFLRTCRIYAWLLSPIILYYCARFYFPTSSWGVQDMGVLGAMPLAYTLLELCLFLMMEVFLYGDETRQKDRKGFIVQDLFLFCLFSIAITLSATKGTIICLAIGSLLLVVYAYLVKRPHRCRAFPAMALSSILLFSTLLTPTSTGGNRMILFLEELMGKNPAASVSVAEIDAATEIIRRLESADMTLEVEPNSGEQPETQPIDTLPNEPSAPEYVNSGKVDEALASGQITVEEADAIKKASTALANTSTGGRKTLWVHALQEIKTAPLTGKGPFFYQEKYGTYPHNLFLEIGTDFGLPVTLLILTLGLYVFIRLIGFSLENAVTGMVTLYVFTYLFRSMVSGSLYSDIIVFQYGVCIPSAFYIIPQVKKNAPDLWESGAPSHLPLKTEDSDRPNF